MQQQETTQHQCSGGNTNAPEQTTPAAELATTSGRFRNFCYTIFPSASIVNVGIEYLPNKMKYLLEGTEYCPNTSRKHFQGFVIFKNPRTLSSVIKEYAKLKGHWEICSGNAKQNMDYCMKDDDYREYGTAPVGRGTRTDLVQLTSLVREGRSDREIIDEVGDRWLRSYRGIQRVREIYFENQPRNWEMDVRIYWGPPGSGKTQLVWEEFGDRVYPKPIGRWWDGYHGQECVLIDDFCPDTCHDMTYSFYLQLLDRYPMFVDPRFGRTQFSSKTIIFTSNICPDEWFDARPNREAFFRRVKSIRYISLAPAGGRSDTAWSSLRSQRPRPTASPVNSGLQLLNDMCGARGSTSSGTT